MNRAEAGTHARLPLRDVRVLDLTDEAAVLAPRLLADLGAEVIRAESLSGDRLRRRGPFLDGEPGLERSLAHLLYNAGKRSLALALDLEESWELLDRLVPAVDVILAPVQKSNLARAFFDHGRMRAAHGKVSVVDVEFRANDARAALTDLVGVAAGGLLYLNGFADDPPNQPAGKLAYKQASLAAALAAMTLLIRSRRTGRGGWMTVNLQEAVAWTTLQTANENYWHWHQQRPGRTGLAGLGRPGSKSIFRCQDGLWASITIHPPYWDRFAAWTAEVTGCRELLGEAWSNPHYRYEHGNRISELTEQVASRLPRDEVLHQGQSHGVLIGPVNSVAEIAGDEQLQARGMFRQIRHPQFDRELTMLRSPFFSSAYDVPGRPAPMLGEDSATILESALSLDKAAIEQLIEQKILGARGRLTAMKDIAAVKDKG